MGSYSHSSIKAGETAIDTTNFFDHDNIQNPHQSFNSDS